MENYISNFRKYKKFSQDRLATEIGRTRSYLSDVERGVKIPSLETLTRIADALEVSIDSLLGRDDKNFYNDVRLGRTEGEKHANN